MVLWPVALGSLLLSMVAKWLADALLQDAPVPLIGSFASLHYALNDGVAFGIQLPGMQSLFILVALLIVLWLAVQRGRSQFERVAFGFIIGGALGNLLDRLPDGFVTDFMKIGSFPVFNLADSWITIGVVLLLADSLRLVRRKQ